jgi:hypothetical protein
MSAQSNEILQILEDVAGNLRRTTRHRLGKDLDRRNTLIVNSALTLTYACWYDLLSFNGQPTADLKRWINSVSTTDLCELVAILKDADGLLLDFSNPDVHDYESFKHFLRKTHQVAGQIIAPLRGLLDAWYTTECTNSFSALHQAFVFLLRLNLKGLTDLQIAAMQAYLDQEEKLKSLTFEDEESSLEANLMQKWFPGKCRLPFFGDWQPRHGSGSVANCEASLREKYCSMGQDAMTRYLDLRLPEGSTVLPRPPIQLTRVSRVVFVPKSVDKLRTICMEPASLQWYQQGFGRALVRYIHRHKTLSRRINLNRQELNRDLAWEGSIDGSLSTIDLSAASDSISYRLIKKWFRRTSLISILMATRSSRAELPDKSIISLDKFSPMGSNINFPIQSLVYTSIIEASIMRSGGNVHASKFRVYGDDLVVETKYVPAVVRRLEGLGFVVNTTKTFVSETGPLFRESCGGEYLNGIDVTPIRLSRRFDGLTMSRRCPSRIEAAIELCNTAYATLPSVRRWTIAQLNKLPIGYRVRFDNSGMSGIFSPEPTNYHLGPLVQHIPWQEWYYRCGAKRKKPLSKKEQKKALLARIPDEDIRLYEYLRVTQQRRRLVYPEDSVATSIVAPQEEIWGRSNTLIPDVLSHTLPRVWERPMEVGSVE